MIKPYWNYSVEIKNVYTYQDFRKKRPKITQQFRFSIIRNQEEPSFTEELRFQLKLLRTLKTVKPIAKVDLKECVITSYDYWKPKLLAACKRISHVRTLLMMSTNTHSKVKCFKYLPKLIKFFYKVHNEKFLLEDYDMDEADEDVGTHDYLQYLKYCPKIRSVNFVGLGEDYDSPELIFEPNRYLRSLESLALRSEQFDGGDFGFPIHSCENLRSISLKFPYSDGILPEVLKSISRQPDLLEITLSSILSLTQKFIKAFAKVTKKGMLKKVQLEFDNNKSDISNLGKVLNSLKSCKLTHFSLRVGIKGKLIKPISQLLKGMNFLESLEIHILNKDTFSEDQYFRQICQHISKLQVLRSLKLHFETSKEFFENQRISNFIPYLAGAFTKPIKIETFSIGCNQLGSSEALQALITVLGNSTISLTHLRIDFGALPCTNKTYRLCLDLFKNLSNIQELEIPCLGISRSTSKFLGEMATIVSTLKYLRVFEIGEINATVTSAVFYETIETIASKRGLRKFSCWMSDGFVENLEKETHIQYPNMKRIIEKNPYLETIEGVDDFPQNEEWMQDLYQI